MRDDPSSARDLLGAARRGDRGARDRLIERHRDRLLGRIRLMMGENARRVAESVDFLQGVMLEVTRDLGEADLRDDAAFLRWATGVARNNIRDAVRRKHERAFASFSATLADPAAADRGPATNALRDEDLHRLAEAMEGLDDEYRQVLELRHFEGLRFAEIGQRMGRSDAAAQMLHTRALARLGRSLG